MTVSFGNGVDIGNLVTAETNPITGVISLNAPGIGARALSQNVPFVIPAGDGGTNGLSFYAGGNGLFTFSAAPMVGIGALLTNCYMYLPANAGGSGCAAGWYFARFSSDTTGTVYADCYVSGVVTVPLAPAQFAGSPSGRITQTTAAVTAPYTQVAGGSIGKNGTLWVNAYLLSCWVAGYVGHYAKLGSANIMSVEHTTSTVIDVEVMVRNAGVENAQINTRRFAYLGVANTTINGMKQTVDTSADFNIGIVLQSTSPLNTAVMLASHFDIVKG